MPPQPPQKKHAPAGSDETLAEYYAQFEEPAFLGDHSLARGRHVTAKQAARQFASKRYTPQAVSAARKIQLWFKRGRRSVRVNTQSGNHSDRVHHFFGHKTEILKSWEHDKVEQLRQALALGNWRDPIFYDRRHDQYAMTLFTAGEITADQMGTILLRASLVRWYGGVQMVPLLNAKGELVTEYMNFFNGNSYAYIGEQFYGRFASVLQQLPASEPFYIELTGRHGARRYIRNGIVLSNGASNAYLLAYVGKHNAVLCDPILGALRKEDIEHGGRHQAHPQNTDFPHIQTRQNVHGSEATQGDATQHDRVHAVVQSQLPQDIQKAMFHVIDTARLSGFHWSISIWNYIDLPRVPDDFLGPLKIRQPVFSSEEVTRYLLALIFHKDKVQQLFFHRALASRTVTPFELDLGDVPTAIGWLFFTELVLHPEGWKKVKVEAEHLPDSVSSFYQLARRYKPDYENDPPVIRSLKCLLLQKMRAGSEQARRDLVEVIDRAWEADAGKKAIRFYRNNKKKELSVQVGEVRLGRNEYTVDAVMDELSGITSSSRSRPGISLSSRA